MQVEYSADIGDNIEPSQRDRRWCNCIHGVRKPETPQLIVVGYNIRRPEELLKRHVHAAEHLGQQEVISNVVHRRLGVALPRLLLRDPESRGRRAGRRGIASPRGSEGHG